MYATCTLNRGFLSPYNPAISYTPNLDRFARDALVFTKHHTEEGQSGIAFASLLSGVQAIRHGVYAHPTPLSESLYLMAEAFRDAGFATFFWANHGMASPALHYGQGVEAAHTFYDERPQIPPNPEAFLRGDDERFVCALGLLACVMVGVSGRRRSTGSDSTHNSLSREGEGEGEGDET